MFFLFFLSTALRNLKVSESVLISIKKSDANDDFSVRIIRILIVSTIIVVKFLIKRSVDSRIASSSANNRLRKQHYKMLVNYE